MREERWGPPVADLVLEGGGTKGLALVGAVAALLDEGYAFPRVAGASAGALVAAFVAAAAAAAARKRAAAPAPAPFLRALAAQLPVADLADRTRLAKVPIVGAYLSAALRGWAFEGDELWRWLHRELGALGVETFADLRTDGTEAARGGDDPDEVLRRSYRLVVVATDITRGELVHLPWDYRRVYGLDPDAQRVADAVRASVALPFAFRPAEVTAEPGGLAPVTADGTSQLVDGGVLANFPIEIFDLRARRRPQRPTFGVKILSRLPPQAGDREMLTPHARLPGLRLGQQVLGTMLGGHSQARLQLPWIAARTIAVDTAGVGVVDFGLPASSRARLVVKGEDATRAFLATWDWDRYRALHRHA